MRNKNTEVVSQNSNTQRITVETNEERDSIQINKEWRRNSEGEWSVSKGIAIPRNSVPELIR